MLTRVTVGDRPHQVNQIFVRWGRWAVPFSTQNGKPLSEPRKTNITRTPSKKHQNQRECFKLPHHKLMSQSFASDIEAKKSDSIKLPTNTTSDERRTKLQQWGRLKESGYPLPEDEDDVSTAYGNSNNNSDCDSDSNSESAKQELTEQMRDLYQTRMVNKNKYRKGRTKEREIAQNAYIARSVGRAKMEKHSRALKAQNTEWSKLWGQKVWGSYTFKNYHQVMYEAKNAGKYIHIGKLFGLCVEKGSELPDGDERKKYKYRVVFQGNRVVDQNMDEAQFQDLGSAPATVEASRLGILKGLLPGNKIEQADAQQAYIQAELGGTETWVEIPEEGWPRNGNAMDHHANGPAQD